MYTYNYNGLTRMWDVYRGRTWIEEFRTQREASDFCNYANMQR